MRSHVCRFALRRLKPLQKSGGAASPKRSLQNDSPSGAGQKCFGSFLLHFHVLDVQGWPHLIPGRTERCPGPRVLVLAAHCAVSALAQPSLLLEDAVGSTVAGWFRWGTWQNQSRNIQKPNL
jgi:hypothetical protein